jgi:tRNA-Thr(GGU) m(6)t(6)A37 methyltransferase TsaA
MEEAITLTPIGFVRSPHREKSQIPKGPGATHTAEGLLEIAPELEEGLTDIEGFSHLYVLWVFHRAEGFDLMSTPPTDTTPHGVFATRSPRRPNPIALTVVELLGREGRDSDDVAGGDDAIREQLHPRNLRRYLRTDRCLRLRNERRDHRDLIRDEAALRLRDLHADDHVRSGGSGGGPVGSPPEEEDDEKDRGGCSDESCTSGLGPCRSHSPDASWRRARATW